MKPEWLLVSGFGLAVFVLSVIGARRPHIPQFEVNVFHAVNGLPDWLLVPLWLPMQLGNLVVGTLAGLAMAVIDKDLALAVGVLVAMALKLVVERLIRREMAAYLAVRQRPGTSQNGAILRGGDVPSSGPSFPSGHVILATAVGCAVLPTVPVGSWPVPLGLITLVMLGRVYVGAHNPLDVTAGFGAGLVLGGGVAALVN